jgi:undecaprenyl-diphosphatase
MSLPIIFGAGLFKGAKVLAKGGFASDLVGPFVWGTLAAAISGFAAIYGLLWLVRTRSFTPFVVYRVVAGLAVIATFGSGLR